MAHYALAAAPTAAPTESVAESAHALETRMLAAAQAVGYNVLFRRALPANMRTALDTQIGFAATEQQLRFVRVVQALGSGRAQLQPWSLPDGQLSFAVKAGPQSLGWFAIALQVIRYASLAAAAAGGYELLDGWTETKKVEADAQLIRAQTDAAVAESARQLQATDPQAAASLLTLATSARASATTGSQSLNWLETAGTAAVGLGTGALLAAAAFYLLGRRSGGRKRNPSSSNALPLALLAAASPAPLDTGVFERIDTANARAAAANKSRDNYYMGLLIAGALLLGRRRKRNPRRRRRAR